MRLSQALYQAVSVSTMYEEGQQGAFNHHPVIEPVIETPWTNGD